MRSAMTRLVLVLLVCASDFTRRATRAGRLTDGKMREAYLGL